MKQLFLVLTLLLSSTFAKSQNRTLVVTALNNYILYSNANTAALEATITSLERYKGLFNDYARRNEKLGGEPYEKPKPSPFVDEDVFTLNEDNPDYLYSKALKESVGLPIPLRSELNVSMKALHACSQKMVALIDSMSNLFSGPLIVVTKSPDLLPYRLLFEATKQLNESKHQRDLLFSKISTYYSKNCSPLAMANDYRRSVPPLTYGIGLCQQILNELRVNDTSKIRQHIFSLDSLCTYLEASELILLKGIQHYGNSKHFPNKGYYDGFDLYTKYEDIVQLLTKFSSIGKNYIKQPIDAEKCFYFHQECSSCFNFTVGLLYHYNEYVLLIGGGKMKLISEDVSRTRTIYKGWGDKTHSFPLHSILFWMYETPRFELEYTSWNK